jgi:hypothetical protein
MILTHGSIYDLMRIFDVFELLYVGVLCVMLAIKIRRETGFGWSLSFFLLTIGGLFLYAAGSRTYAPVRIDLVAVAIRAVLAVAATVAYVAFVRRLRGLG